ncbi:hypothetical protein ACFQZQ_11605 [Lysobacter koreensis]|uniref:Uncharacterized protein n=1 Tax=Lysobacter koreensis TaxID=266122 RepID=A0ABW2YND8_9GAMM
MLKHVAVALISSALAVASASVPAQRGLVRIDATSSESAEASYKAMMRDRSAAEQQKLALAVLVLNMEGVESAREAMDNPELQSPSIGRIKDKVAGMTAKQIIETAARNPSVRIEVSGQ